MQLQDIYKQSNLCKILAKDISNGTINHSYMLILPDKILADNYAKFFAMQLYCDNHNCCEKCNNCKKIIHDNMSDISFYPKGNRLSVEESRQIVSDSFVLPYEQTKKLFIIKNFDEATTQSQNALLKVLEEPTQSNIFLLIATSESTVLRTILSRTKKIVESPLDSQVMKEYLTCQYTSIDNNKIEEVVNFCNGSVTNAVDLLTNKKYNELLSDVHSVLLNLKGSADVLQASNILMKYKDNLQEVMDIIMQIFLDFNISILSGKTLDSVKDLSEIIKLYNPRSIAKITEKLIDCKNRIQFNCSSVAIIDYLLFGILEARYTCK